MDDVYMWPILSHCSNICMRKLRRNTIISVNTASAAIPAEYLQHMKHEGNHDNNAYAEL
jgi:hypothetical protein